MIWKHLTATAFAAAALGAGTSTALAQSQYLGEVKITANNFCPRDWKKADGQFIPINDNFALFALLGCEYGGDCQTSFALPDLRGRTPVGYGFTYSIGTRGGSEQALMTIATMPAHSHELRASSSGPSSISPTGRNIATFPPMSPVDFYSTAAPGAKTMSVDAIGVSQGAAAPFPVRQPGLGMYFCIATQGVFPLRN